MTLSRFQSLEHSRSFFRSIRAPLLVCVAISSGTLSCSKDTTGPTPQSASQAFWTLALNQHAVNLAFAAPYNTFQLTVNPLTQSGTPLESPSATTFHANDSSVTVSPSGLVTAHFSTSLTTISVAVTSQGVTLQDTVFIQVTPTPPASSLATFSIHAPSGDSAKRSLDSDGFMLPLVATDVAHDTVCHGSECTLQIFYASSDPTVATINRTTGVVSQHDTGHVVFTATTWAYGVARRDSVVFTIGYTLGLTTYAEIRVTKIRGISTVTFDPPPQVVLGVGAKITFRDLSPYPVDVVFTGPAAPDTASCFDQISTATSGTGELQYAPPTGTGNIGTFGGDTTTFFDFLQYAVNQDLRCRSFPVPGVYRYHSTLFPSDTFKFDVRVQH